MCGIAGKLSDEGVDSVEVLARMRHRGPDSNGEHAEGKVWFGHTRLSILDLSEAGAQPMNSRDGRWLVTFNGEIYNHLALRSRVDVPFQGHSDTETLVELLSAGGIHATLPLLNGMFAFAALDRSTNTVYLARDPFGIKPLYLHHSTDQLCFASEIKALVAMGVTAEVDPQALSTLFTLGYVPSPQTMLRNVQRLGPGQLLIWHEGQATIERYIQTHTHRTEMSLEEASDAYRDRLAAAVERQLISDVPVGVLLSGGIDSALVATMAREAGHQPKTFTVGFGGGSAACEIDDAAETARVLGLSHRSVLIEPDVLWEQLPSIVNALEEPLASLSPVAMWDLVKLAREEVTVALAGQGSDESWGGYSRYRMEYLRRWASPASRLIRPLSGSRRLEVALPGWSLRALRAVGESDPARRFRYTYEIFPDRWRTRLLGGSDVGTAEERIRDWLHWTAPAGVSSCEQMMRVDGRMQLADDFFVYGDKISMSVSLEMRVPMADLELTRFVDGLPLHLKLNSRRQKILHKHMASRYLPDEIVNRKKKGFEVPVSKWSRTVWQNRVAELLLAKGSPHHRYLKLAGLEQFWKDHLRSSAPRGRQIYLLMMFALWCRWLEQLNEGVVSER